MRKFVFFSIFALTLLVFFNANANDKYMVNVDVDVTSSDSASAREKAMTKANRQAFLEIVNKNTDASYYERFANFTDEQILNFIKEVEVSEEKASSYRYAARLQVLVDGDLLLEYMKENNIPTTYKNSSYVMIVPVYYEQGSEQPKLWEEDNHWRYVWEQKGVIQRGEKNFLSVPATEENQSMISANDQNLSRRTIAKLTENNPANKVYIAILKSDLYGYLNIDVIDAKNGEKSDIRIYGMPNEKNFNIAADMVIARLQSSVNEAPQKKEEKNETSEMIIIFASDNPADLIEARKKIDNLPEIKKTTLLTIGNGKAKLVLEIASRQEQAAYAISRVGYSIAKDEGVFVITKGK